ncbi:MAG TPA: hypothetical protein VJ998_12585 [Pseudomonadales bacterium]|nr:hypothetical protein [Pseudomonadales bacterium]
MRELTFDEVREVSGGSTVEGITYIADGIATFAGGAALVGAEPVAAAGFALAGGLYIGAGIDEMLF